MLIDWEIARPSGQCAICQRLLSPGEEHTSRLMEQGDRFVRQDVCAGCREAPLPSAEPNQPPVVLIGQWRTRVAVRAARKRRFPDDTLVRNLFDRCGSSDEPMKQNFRFVLALMLMRKKHLRFESAETRDGREIWQLIPADGGPPISVVIPRLSEEQMSHVSEQLSAILDAES